LPKRYKKPTLTQLKLFHYEILKTQGQEYLSLPQIKEQVLEAILEGVDQNVFGTELYPTLCDKAIYLLMSIDRSQAFPDGNKRVALATFEFFLHLNGSTINNTISQKLKERFMLSIATNQMDKKQGVECCIKAIKG